MANLVIFPDHAAFQQAFGLLTETTAVLQVLDTPTFCAGLIAPAILTTNTPRQLAARLGEAEIPYSGVLPYCPIRKDVPDAPPPDALWKKILGGLRIAAVRPSLTDPLRLRVEAIPENSLEQLIPLMARLIRGGAYRPEIPVLAFEEDHRLLAFSSRALVISRADHLLDIRIMLRCAIDLICSAWKLRSSIEPDPAPRQGIGAIEIFKRLPATNCGQCGHAGCMEFARCLFTGRTGMESCLPLSEPEYAAHRKSLLWLLHAIGLLRADPGLCEESGQGEVSEMLNAAAGEIMKRSAGARPIRTP